MILLLLIFGTISAFWARRKGYNPYIWFFTAGIIGLIVLAFLPSAVEETLSNEQKSAAKKKGNIIGGCIAVLFLIFTAVLLVQFSMKTVGLKADRHSISAIK